MDGLLYLFAFFGLLIFAKWLACLGYERDCRRAYEQKLENQRAGIRTPSGVVASERSQPLELRSHAMSRNSRA